MNRYPCDQAAENVGVCQSAQNDVWDECVYCEGETDLTHKLSHLDGRKMSNHIIIMYFYQ